MMTADTNADVPLAPVRANSVEHWAEVAPDAIAVVEGERSLTWKEWDDASNRVAEAFSQRGVVAGDLIALRTQIRLEYAILSQALAKLDCAMLGLNWRLTPAEVTFCLSNSKACGIVCDDTDPAPLVDALRDLPIKVAATIEGPAQSFEAFSDLLKAPLVVRNSQRDAPMVLYTSGTTGRPKGVVPTGAPGDPEKMPAYLDYVASMGEGLPRTRSDAALITMPFSHGAGPSLVRGAIAGGTKMIFVRRFDPALILDLIERHKISTWSSVPTMLKRLASLPDEVLARHDLSSMKLLSTGAAPVPPSIKAWVRDKFGPILREGYGATEVGMISFMTADNEARKPGSSGQLYRQVSVRIRDENGADLPRGEVGEIWVRTPVTISQYLNAGDLDDSTRDADGHFRTGDVGYLDDDNFIFITDRAKDMIISGGVNIYPAEIETVLIQHPAVQDVAVIGIPDDEFGESVKAFIEVKPGHSVTSSELVEFARDSLASYKRPKSIDLIEELPRNPMGKILKKDLREPYWVGRERKV